jgi:magnesium-transporting ATPase (P-type)
MLVHLYACTSTSNRVHTDGTLELSLTVSKTSSNSLADRKRTFKDNRLPTKTAKSIWKLAWIMYNDKVMILLTVAAAVSLAPSHYQTFGQKHEIGEAKVSGSKVWLLSLRYEPP